MFPDDPPLPAAMTTPQNEQPPGLLHRSPAPIAKEPNVLARSNVRMKSVEWAGMQVAQQVASMGIHRFEVGVLTSDPARGKTMMLKVLNSNEVISHSVNLRRLNAAGADIHIRPKEEGGYQRHPERFVRRPPQHPSLPDAVWINPPASNKENTP